MVGKTCQTQMPICIINAMKISTEETGLKASESQREVPKVCEHRPRSPEAFRSL